jgi:hypothetical protein
MGNALGGATLKKCLLKCTGLLIGLVFIFSLLTQPAVAVDVEWEDNFDDETYLPEWTVKTGSFCCDDKKLAGTYDSTPDAPTFDRFDNEIWINSTVSYGTWSFDLYYGCHYLYGPAVWFTCDRIDPGAEWIGVGWPGGKGLCLQRHYDRWSLHRVDGGDGGTPSTWNATPDGSYGLGTLYNVYFTYDDTGYFDLWINGTYIGLGANFHSRYHFQSQNVLVAMNEGSWIDNIKVWDEILPYTEPTTSTDPTNLSDPTDPTTPPPQPMDTTLLIAGAGVAVVIIAAVVFLKKR